MDCGLGLGFLDGWVMGEMIVVVGAGEHNLKGFDLELPRGALVVVTGVSGSGKSSLAFHTLFREGQRRYLETFSAQARRFLGKLARPVVRSLGGVSPAVAVDQRRVVASPRSTLGTMTGLYDHLRLLFSRCGQVPCAGCGLLVGPGGSEVVCSGCGGTVVAPSFDLFSFNGDAGACPACRGLGVVDRVDPELLIADHGLSLREGALVPTTPTGYIVYSQVTLDVLELICQAHGFGLDTPWRDLAPAHQQVVLYGSQLIKVPFGKHPLESRMRWKGITAKPRKEGYYRGIVPVIEEILERSRNKNALRFVRTRPCPECAGQRLGPAALGVTWQGRNIAEFAALTVREWRVFLAEVDGGEPGTGEILAAMGRQLKRLERLGLGHFTLDRESTAITAGEGRRIRLAGQAGAGLGDLLFVLDEPGAGLHARDRVALLEILFELRDQGNTVVVVEHDEETIRAADWIVDIGPGAGEHGGEVVYNGPAAPFLAGDGPITGPTQACLRGEDGVTLPDRWRKGTGELVLRGAVGFNLQGIDVTFKLGALNAVTGVAGAGKATLVQRVLGPALAGNQQVATIECAMMPQRVITVNQKPIGRTPRSNPVTYTKVFDHIRALFAALPEAREKGFGRGTFSFNNKGGRCEECGGAGVQSVGMHFLEDVEYECPACRGRRFKEEVLAIKWQGLSIRDVLDLSIEEACDFFAGEPQIAGVLKVMLELGLGYLPLGRPSTTLSGGEAQRIKLTLHLAGKRQGRTLFILDEPTTGLHPSDAKLLAVALGRLVDAGNTVVMIENNLAMLRAVDWIVDLGPGNGKEGGRVVVSGTPATVADCAASPTGAALGMVLAGKDLELFPHPGPPPPAKKTIELQGVSTNNLKAIDVSIPREKLTVITGLSGSGKSSLAFDTIYAEGWTRFAENLSTYARRFLGGERKARVAKVSGLTATVAPGRAPRQADPRSTVGTVTEIRDRLRLLYSRAGKGATGLTAGHFSTNRREGACPACGGPGWRLVADPEALITNPECSIVAGAMDGSKTGRFYGEPQGQYVATLQVAASATGVDLSLPWGELDEAAQDLVMNGTGEREYDVCWAYQRGTRQGNHEFNGPWRGFVRLVEEEFERKRGDQRGQAMLGLMAEESCAECGGCGLQSPAREVTFAGLTLPELTTLPIATALTFFNSCLNKLETREREVANRLLPEVTARLAALIGVGLEYLSLARRVYTLSGGEAGRLRLAALLVSGLRGLTCVFDEPTLGLHSAAVGRLIEILRELRDRGNTVVVVEHDEAVIRAADHVLDMGPGPGNAGGRIIAAGSPEAIAKDEGSVTGPWLAGKGVWPAPRGNYQYLPGVQVSGAKANNLKKIDAHFPAACLTVVTGVSGAGKSSLVFGVLAASAAAGRPTACRQISGLENFSRVLQVDSDAGGVGRADLTPATSCGLWTLIRNLLAQSETARAAGLKPGFFSLGTKGGRCETCKGTGRKKVALEFLGDLYIPCSACAGKRFGPQAQTVRWSGLTPADLLRLTVTEARKVFSKHKVLAKALDLLEQAGLGYIHLGQPGNTLSGGERQRLRLATELIAGGKAQKGDPGKPQLYIFDEPTRGLHFEDTVRLIDLFHRLANQGHGLVVVEHHPRVVAAADQVVKLGPKGGPGGGFLTE